MRMSIVESIDSRSVDLSRKHTGRVLRTKRNGRMLYFIVVDNESKIKSVDLYDEKKYRDHYKIKSFDDDGFESPQQRIECMVNENLGEVVWSREKAVLLITDEIKALSIEGGEDEEVREYAKMLIKIGQNAQWDSHLNSQFPTD